MTAKPSIPVCSVGADWIICFWVHTIYYLSWLQGHNGCKYGGQSKLLYSSLVLFFLAFTLIFLEDYITVLLVIGLPVI